MPDLDYPKWAPPAVLRVGVALIALEYPKWAPPAVRVGVQLIAATRYQIDEELIRRLLTDERMKAIWGFLGNPKKCAASPAAVDICRDHPVLDGLSDQDIALAVFFCTSYFYAHFRFRTLTTASLLKKREPYLALAKRLREDAQHLRECWSADSEVEAHVAAIDAAVTFHTNKMKQLVKPSPRLVGRDQYDPYQRAYALYMADYARWLFGKYMYGTDSSRSGPDCSPCDCIVPLKYSATCSAAQCNVATLLWSDLTVGYCGTCQGLVTALAHQRVSGRCSPRSAFEISPVRFARFEAASKCVPPTAMNSRSH
jgi:hypothetical protein